MLIHFRIVERSLRLDILKLIALIRFLNNCTMKIFTISMSVLLIFTLATTSAQNPLVAKRIKEIGQRYESLPLEQRTRYLKLKQKAIDDALNIFPDDMDLIWLQGICRAQIHDVDKAIAHYDAVRLINPNHVPSLMNLVEINFFAGRYEETIKQIDYLNKLIKSRGSESMPLLNFKYLISLTKLAEENPEKYKTQLQKGFELHTYMEDNPYYYYSNALKQFSSGNKQEGLIWILKAYLIFQNPALIETWNKALVDTNFIDAHEIMFNREGSR